MKKNYIYIGVLVVLVGVLALARSGGEKLPEGVHRMPDGSLMSHEDMGHMDMTVSSEQDFIEKMIPHHQEAVDTAQEVLERGAVTEEVRTLVENIIVAQEKEIADMKEWYFGWYGKEYKDTGEYVPMMRDLSELSGAEIDQVFLQDMIMHHMGAIMMARSVEPFIEHEEISTLTQAIIQTQTQEINLMMEILGKY